MGRHLTKSEVPTKTDELVREVTTSDDDAFQLLKSIYTQLRIMNIQFGLITETEIKENDL